MANAASGVAVADECVARFQELRTGSWCSRSTTPCSVWWSTRLRRPPRRRLPLRRLRPRLHRRRGAPQQDLLHVVVAGDGGRQEQDGVYASSNEGFKKELDGVQATEPSELTLDVLNDHVSSS
ncbi:unnamed protein product [Urochloa decumbens]|uniref:Uncharacterized protein n=1 Tax=Urochloa decumbens TaxID=240449 RepID=A0ABC8YA93_9POAL